METLDVTDILAYLNCWFPMSEDEKVELLVARQLWEWTVIPAVLISWVTFWTGKHKAFYVDDAATVLVRMADFATLCTPNSLPRLWESGVFRAEGFHMWILTRRA
jgi:hypothetical protein